MEHSTPSTSRELGLSRFDSDPEALAWARGKIEREIERLDRWRDAARAEGKLDQAKTWRRISAHLHNRFIGGGNCVIAAFDERLPEMIRAMDAGRSES